MTRIALACDGNGFGPVSKLTAIANLLPEVERIFVGDGGAYSFAQRNRSSYEQIVTPDEFWAAEMGKSCDFAIVVMEPDMLFGLLQLSRPVYLFDSLIESWVLPSGIAPLAAAAQQIRFQMPGKSRTLFESFTSHERMILAHMLATRSFAQNFPGVPERVAELRRHGVEGIQLLGPMIDARSYLCNKVPPPQGDRWTMLISLGGVRCSGVEFYRNDHIIELMERWAKRNLQSDQTCREILLCCGRYGSPAREIVGSGVLTRQLLHHDAFIETMAKVDVVATAAGRTTLHEAVHIGKLPVLLPEQHYNQYCNIKVLTDVVGDRLSVSLKHVIGLDGLPDDDVEGTAFLAEGLYKILCSDQLFNRFDNALRCKIEEIRSLEPREKQQLIDTIGRHFGGMDFATAVRSLATSVG